MIDPDIAENALHEVEEKRVGLRKSSGNIYLLIFSIPILISLFLLGNNAIGPGFFIPFFLTCLVSFGIYFFKIYLPFEELKANMKSILLAEFMKVYHPDIQYRYSSEKRDVKKIVKASNLVSADYYEEEDVIEGNLKDGSFYISEIHLKSKSRKTTVTTFKGLLFSLTIPGRSFPSSQIQSKVGFLSKMFNGFIKNEKHGFWYETNDLPKFEEELSLLLPFISHLMKSYVDVRIKTHGNQITLMLDTPMKFLDEPKPRLSNTFNDSDYYDQLGLQLNSLLFIVESFVNGLDNTDIEERLELKALELSKKYTR